MVTSDGPSSGRPLHEKVQVVVQGDIPFQAYRWAVRAVERVARQDPWPLVRAQVRVTRPPHLAATCRADIEADLGGHLLLVRAEAGDARSAIDIAADRLHHQAEAARRRT